MRGGSFKGSDCVDECDLLVTPAPSISFFICSVSYIGNIIQTTIGFNPFYELALNMTWHRLVYNLISDYSILQYDTYFFVFARYKAPIFLPEFTHYLFFLYIVLPIIA